jgi:phenylacetic acid degradation operon negative regulatory protein
MTIVRRSWNLDEVSASYAQMMAEFADRRPASGDELLLAHVALVNEMQRFPFLDPQLPDELLGSWVGHDAAQLFEARRAEWTADAHARWAEVVDMTTPPELRHG